MVYITCIKFNERVNLFFFSSLAAFILIVLSMQLLDFPLAAWIAEYLGGYAPYLKTTNIPDPLLILVVILTSLSWGAYFYLVRRNIHNQRSLFFCVTGTVLPVSFGMKTILKWLFGRTETRTWLSDPTSYGFHWFAGTEGSQGFPSGHMLVLTPLFMALWYFYPRYRLYYAAVWVCLGAALLTTEYHFLSDVLAGAYIGAIVYLAVRRTVE